MTACFHCGETIPKGLKLTANIEGFDQPMCCIGCQAVATFLNDNDHAVFYQYREGKLPAEQTNTPSNQWKHLDEPEVFASLTTSSTPNSSQITIKVEGMYCSACAWLIHKVMKTQKGIQDTHINAVTQNVQIEFNPALIKLSEIFSQIDALGYHPLQQQSINNEASDERKKQLKKIAVAGFGMMFIMTLAVPLYSPDQFAFAPHIQRFFLMISMLIATGVYFYSGLGFVKNAIRDIKNKHLGMDVPVALSISLAYFFSIYLSFKQQGHVYFDSMAMFVFFLLLGRYVESQVRHKGMNVRESLFALVPVSAERVISNNQTATIPLNQVEKGHHLKVKGGAVIPCDGVIIQGQGQVNEAILTGESQLIDKAKGEMVFAGAQLSNGEITLETTVNNQHSFLAKLADLMELAQSKKPPSLQLVDKIASYFVAGVLILATLTALWYGLFQNQAQGSDQMMTALLAVLIATCPCALSLATPTALTAAGINLLEQGVLVNNTEAITQLEKIKHWYFDKTGTLSDDQLNVKNTHNCSDQKNLQDITNTLQQVSNHPIASAFLTGKLLAIDGAESIPGKGVTGLIAGDRWQMGSQQWLSAEGIAINPIQSDASHTVVYLACNGKLVAAFELQVSIRAGAKTLLAALSQKGIEQTIISGDQQQTVDHWGKMLGISQHHAELSAEEKIAFIASQQATGIPCVMVGDGVNDAPVLSQADVSISLKQGSYLAHSASDLIILGQSLQPLIQAMKISKKTNQIIKQNLLWSLVYNLSITPIAMMGLLAPWMAAIGMSLSSLLVVLNSRRLL